MEKAIRYILLPGLLLILVIIYSCQKKIWDDHYNSYPGTVNMKLIDALKEHSEYSLFLKYMNQTGLDSLLISNESKTLFIPRNEAFDQLSPVDTLGYMSEIMAYHISPAIFLSNNMLDSRKLLTNTGKYLFIEVDNGNILIDKIPVDFSSSLYLDGKFYELSNVLFPPPSI